MEQCTAKSKRSQQRCRKPPMRGRTTCAMHGGVTTILGPANKNYKTGRYSKVLPLQLAARASEALRSPRLLSLSDDIAVCEALLAERMQRLETGESGQRWREVRTQLAAFDAAMATGDVPAGERAMQTLQALTQAGADADSTVAEIQKLWDTRCRLVQTEMKTMTSLQQMVTVQQVLVHSQAQLEAITRVVRRHLADAAGNRILSDIAVEFSRLSNLDAAG